ncbi:hypothetical protein K469DRAFT_689582 [Zopfia rhizophila CBS 207.26]|uniref:Uncharacterized protein n=1 Tax=Zopfia rhizophila CBS 207.26 TaxID=1314779 RepID=A0A6A6DVX1_9PEZI|nr:hypothetical protein K469DRAFT_689582 [Zopfia rhizophila CBS 207.26]
MRKPQEILGDRPKKEQKGRFGKVHTPIFTIAYLCDPLARKKRHVVVTSKMNDEIQNKSRNRLANPKVEMLAYLFTNLRIRDQIKSEDPQYFDDDEVEENEADELEDDYGDFSQIAEGLAISKDIDRISELTKLTNVD